MNLTINLTPETERKLLAHATASVLVSFIGFPLFWFDAGCKAINAATSSEKGSSVGRIVMAA